MNETQLNPPPAPQWAATSKTLWGNALLAALVELSPQVNAWVCTHPQTAMTLCCGMNFIFRHFTEAPIQYARPKD